MTYKQASLQTRGFTLIEIMVATLLVAMMSVLIMSSLNTSIRSKDNAEKLSQRFHEASQAMARMTREISMAFLSKNFNALEPAYVTQFKGKKNSLFFTAFGYVVHQKDAKQSDQQVLGFFLAPDKSGQQALMRRIHPNLNLDVEKGGRIQVLCSNVTKLEFSYFDNRLDKWSESWLADPTIQAGAFREPANQEKDGEKDSSTPKPWRLPNRVKITMTVIMEEGDEMTWIGETEIPVQEPLDFN